MSQNLSQSTAFGTNPHLMPTPASTVGATFSSIDSDGDVRMADGQDDDADTSSGTRHSNHDRQGRGVPSSRRHESSSALATGDALFNICQNSLPQSRPHCTQNLLELYGLNDLARSVARTDPISGEKINKLRKSYEGHIKAMQIAGKAKATKMEFALTGPLGWPDPIWEAEKGNIQQMKETMDDKGHFTAGFNEQLNRALSGMAPGPLPSSEAQKYRAYLGTDEITKPKADGILSRNPLHTSSIPTPSHTTLAQQRLSRPERSGSKRSYEDGSFQGYGEGIDPDYPQDSAGGEDGGSMSKKRKLGFEGASRAVEVGGARR